jgi:hypothetical protein
MKIENFIKFIKNKSFKHSEYFLKCENFRQYSKESLRRYEHLETSEVQENTENPRFADAFKN